MLGVHKGQLAGIYVTRLYSCFNKIKITTIICLYLIFLRFEITVYKENYKIEFKRSLRRIQFFYICDSRLLFFFRIYFTWASSLSLYKYDVELWM